MNSNAISTTKLLTRMKRVTKQVYVNGQQEDNFCLIPHDNFISVSVCHSHITVSADQSASGSAVKTSVRNWRTYIMCGGT